MSAADCPGCGLPVATPADAGSWTPDGTVCWRGGRCEVPVTADADADYEHALGGLRGHIVYGEQTAGDTPVAWVQVKVALPYLRNAERVLVAERARAEAADARSANLLMCGEAAERAAEEAHAQHAALAALVRAYLAAEETMRLVAADDHRRDTYHEWAKRHGAAMDAVDAARAALVAGVARCAP